MSATASRVEGTTTHERATNDTIPPTETALLATANATPPAPSRRVPAVNLTPPRYVNCLESEPFVKHAPRLGLRLSVALLIVLSAFAVAQASSTRTQGDLLRLSPTMLDGFYDAERSTTLPGASGPLSREFRWMQPSGSLRLWPILSAGGLLELEYLNPAQDAQVNLQIDDRSALALPPTPALRTIKLLLPAQTATIRLTQAGSVASADRALGMIVSEARWSGLPGFGWAALAEGLPLTIVLLWLLFWLCGASLRTTLGTSTLVIVGIAVLSWRWPWASRALQPMLQGLLLWASAAAALRQIVRRRRPAWSRRWPLLIGAVWALSTLLYLTPTVGHDGVGYYAYLRSFFIDGDLRFANDFDPAQSVFADVPEMGAPLATTGYTSNTWSVGPALYWTPFWLLAHGLVYLGGALGLPWQPNGYAPPYIALIALASSLTGLATMLGCFVLARRWFSATVAALAAITIYLGSNLLFYAQLEGSFAHSLSAATTTWFMVATLHLDDQPTLRSWLLFGMATGAMIVTYWITAMLLLVPLALMLRVLWRLIRAADWRSVAQLITGAGLAAVVALPIFLPQMVAWRQIFGGWLATPQGNDFITPDKIHLLDVLISPLYGIVWWTPAYAIGLLGATWFALRRPWPGVPLLLTMLLYVLYNASLPEWFGNGGFGMRRLTPLAPVCALGLAAILNALRRAPALALAGAICGWGMQMTARYVVYELPHDPYVLMDLSVRDLMLTPDRVALAPLAAMARTSWLGRFVQSPNLGDALVLLCLLLGGMLVVGWRWPYGRTVGRRPQPDRPQPTISS